jgi:hypothetical protein
MLDRRAFLGTLFAAVPALGGGAALLERLCAEPEPEPVWIESFNIIQWGCRLRSGQETTMAEIKGPCRFYDLVAYSDSQGANLSPIGLSLRRSTDRHPMRLMAFSLDPRASLRWIAAPMQEIIIPEGGRVLVRGICETDHMWSAGALVTRPLDS